MGELRSQITNKLKKISEARVMVKPEDYDKVSSKLEKDDEVIFVDEGSDMDDEDYERASREVEYGVNPETGVSWDELLKQTGEEGKKGNNTEVKEDIMNPQQTIDGVNIGKLRGDVQKLMDKLNIAQLQTAFAKIDKPAEQAEVIAAFAERIGVPRTKLPTIMQTIKTMSEDVRPKMKKDALVEFVLNKKQK